MIKYIFLQKFDIIYQLMSDAKVPSGGVELIVSKKKMNDESNIQIENYTKNLHYFEQKIQQNQNDSISLLLISEWNEFCLIVLFRHVPDTAVRRRYVLVGPPIRYVLRYPILSTDTDTCTIG